MGTPCSSNHQHERSVLFRVCLEVSILLLLLYFHCHYSVVIAGVLSDVCQL